MSKQRAIVTFDLDSTLANTKHRHHMIAENRDETDWVAYSMACAHDAPFSDAVALARTMSVNYDVWIVSGRSEQARALTEAWLAAQKITYIGMILADDSYGSHQSHSAYKVDKVRQVEAITGQKVFCHVDDRHDVGRALEVAGYATLVIEPDYTTDYGGV